ncbi:MAG: PD-(D/E)XK nuclease family protein [Desulfohalobiaceae bacterium]|nr:PD-(D/E)XK nuclease family protein [Desulfohalobiaceae bacterium]
MPEFSFISLQEAWAELERGGVLLTVNSRSARTLSLQYARNQAASGSTVFETPRIFTVKAWLEHLFQELVFAMDSPESAPFPELLSPEQELLLWEEIILESGTARGLLRTRETASLAAGAWELTRAFRIDRRELCDWDVPDYQAFWEWSLEFEKRLGEQGWLDRGYLPDMVAEEFSRGGLPVPETVILAGFDEFTPQELDMFNSLASAHCRLYILKLPEYESRAGRAGFTDAREEMQQAALWAGRAVQDKPGTRVGIIVPDLASRKEELSRILQEVLHPEQGILSGTGGDRSYNLSLGQSLLDYPVIRAAMNALGLRLDPLPFSLMSQMLRSPFIKGAEREAEGRCRLENSLRRSRERYVPRDVFLELMHFDHQGLEQESALLCPELAACFKEFQELLASARCKQTLSGWAETFSFLLKALGWPGERSLNSEEYQCVSAWFKGLQQFAALDPLGREYGFEKAVHHLEHLLASSVFQPEQEEAAIQVLGQLEAASEIFDRLWIMGLTDETWPRAARPHPLLPVALQQRLGLPHSSAKRELAYCSLITGRLLASAPRVIVSYPEQEQDRELFPSPLISHLPEIDGREPLLAQLPSYWQAVHDSRDLELYSDEYGPALRDGTPVRGGTGVLKAQSLCPFQAFARYRLGAEEPEEPVSGLGPAERGILIHAGLESFWEEVKHQQQLLDLDAKALLSTVRRAVAEAIKRVRTEHGLSFTRRFTAIETERLTALLLEWLEQEKERPLFTVIGHEQRRSVTINGLQFNTVVDRIDRLEDGKVLVVDYKSGQNTVNDWLGERPAEPQVPIYSLIGEQEPAGVYFGLVRKGGCRFIGIGESEGLIPGTHGFDASKICADYGSWKELLACWKQQLEDLAGEFKQGWAGVMPLSRQKSCRNCALQPLCRIYEREAEA